jgi:hypothetical protein
MINVSLPSKMVHNDNKTSVEHIQMFLLLKKHHCRSCKRTSARVYTFVYVVIRNVVDMLKMKP